MRAMECLQHLGEPGAGEVFRGADAQAALQARAAQPGAGLALELDDISRVGVQRFTGSGQFETTRGACQQDGAGGRFKAFDVAADRGRRQRQRVRRQRETAVVHDLEKGAQQRQVQHGAGEVGRVSMGRNQYTIL